VVDSILRGVLCFAQIGTGIRDIHVSNQPQAQPTNFYFYYYFTSHIEAVGALLGMETVR